MSERFIRRRSREVPVGWIAIPIIGTGHVLHPFLRFKDLERLRPTKSDKWCDWLDRMPAVNRRLPFHINLKWSGF